MNTTTSTYIPSFLEKLLGRRYKWWYLFKYWIKANTTYFWSEVFVSLNRTLTLFGICVIFLYLSENGAEGFLNYLLLGSIFFSITDPVISWDLSNSIKNGKITKSLLYPIKYLHYLFFTAVSNCLYLFTTSLVALIPVLLVFHKYLDLSSNFLVLIPLILISFLIRFSIQAITGFATFWFVEGSGINHLIQNLENFLSGSMFPLFILPFHFTWLQYIPFAFTFYHPMQIYLGKYDLQQTILVFVGGIAWCIVLYFLAKLVFKAGLKRNESVGL